MTGPRLSIIPARAATDPALKPRDLQVLCVLGRHTDDLGWCRKSQVKMADEMGCARSTVFEAVERLVKAGYLERYVQDEVSGRDSPHVYRVILDPVHPRVEAIRDADDPCRYTGTPADIPAPPAGPEPAPPAGPEPAPKNDPFRTTDSERSEREGAREGEKENARQVEATFWKLVKHWPGFDGMPKEPAKRAWFALSAEDRAEAEAKFPAWLALLKAQRKSHTPAPSTYFSERLWTAVPDAPDEPPKPLDAPPFGPLWNAMRFRALLTEPPVAGPKASALIEELMARQDAVGRQERLSRQARYGWPKINSLHDRAINRRGIAVDPRHEALQQLMEPVVRDGELWKAWRAEHEKRGWPWIPDPGGMRAVWFPKGGPERLADFEAAVRGNDDGQQSQSAAAE
ncbi:helix-turn-helix domain-containing protein [Tianweitania sediminis]|uniref:Helix-turn-helix domain-containing protein n=1 Tax=Tianweitania sediminis TaxID=1502156 RepID=A0A8J7R483_9HYPH|nr:helix-turn-helix domain-containing protein [Tianweitania sediminis]MBP0439600.1 helix-turn-helix domain-containing protein [Tianweitania sediminis]